MKLLITHDDIIKAGVTHDDIIKGGAKLHTRVNKYYCSFGRSVKDISYIRIYSTSQKK